MIFEVILAGAIFVTLALYIIRTNRNRAQTLSYRMAAAKDAAEQRARNRLSEPINYTPEIPDKPSTKGYFVKEE